MITLEQAKEARDKFIKTFYKHPVNSVGASKGNQEFVVMVGLENAEKPDWLPNEIDGVKVIYRNIGNIELL